MKMFVGVSSRHLIEIMQSKSCHPSSVLDDNGHFGVTEAIH
jgi:hypothetical protein